MPMPFSYWGKPSYRAAAGVSIPAARYSSSARYSSVRPASLRNRRWYAAACAITPLAYSAVIPSTSAACAPRAMRSSAVSVAPTGTTDIDCTVG